MASEKRRRLRIRSGVAFFLAVSTLASAEVDCGGHIKNSCRECPTDPTSGRFYGQAWCNGECKWIESVFMGTACMDRAEQEKVREIAESEGISYGVWLFIQAVFFSIFACVYKVKVVDKLPKFYPHPPDSRARQKSLFSCACELDTCLYTIFCMPIVAAKNWDAAGVCGFWPGCLLMSMCTYTPFYPLAVIIRTVLSGRLREKLGFEQSCCWDCIATCFCFPCEVGRESLEVDEELGVRIECCCPHVEPTTARAEEELFHLSNSPAVQQHASHGVAPKQERFGLVDEFQKFDHALASHDPLYNPGRLERDLFGSHRGLHFG